MTRLATLTALALSLAGAAFGAYTVAREAVVLERWPERSVEEYDRIASGRTALGLSAYSKKQILNSCYYGLTAPLALVRPAVEIRGFASRCRDKAEAITSTMPTVIIDTPPVDPVVDSLYLARHADVIAFVVRWASTSQTLARKSVATLLENARPDVPVIAVLNQKEQTKVAGYYKYSGYYTK